MKPRKPSFTFKSFQELRALLEKQSFPPQKFYTDFISHQVGENPEMEERLFQKAMEGVTPIPRDKYVERIFQLELPKGLREKEDAEVLERLTALVKYGKGFNVEDTPEYIEGTGYHIHPSVARRLHQGEYSIQAFVDLHGLLSKDAKEVLEKFLKWALTTGKTGVLIVHGRGLSSPSEPVLKRKVVEWLTRGPWRKWIAAYASARICDGGAGATYVLLRSRPVSKRIKIRKGETKKR